MPDLDTALLDCERAAELEPCEKILTEIPLIGAQTVFLSGSRAEGWSSEGSNYNLYVVGEVPDPVRPIGGFGVPPSIQRVAAHHVLIGDVRAVIRYWRPADVEWAITAVRHHELRPTVEIWPPAIQFLHRLRIGVPLHGYERFEELRSAMDADLLARYLTQNRAMYSESYYTDAVTRRAAGRSYDALLQARLAFETAVDSYLASQGDTNPQEKWRHQRVARLAPALRDDFERAVRGPGPEATADGLDRYILTLLHLAETLNCCVQLACTYDTLTIASPVPVTGGTLVERKVDVRLARRYDGRAYAVRMDGRAVELSPIAALVYGCADGRWYAPQIAAHAANRLGLRSADAAADVQEVVRALASRDFLTSPADPGRG